MEEEIFKFINGSRFILNEKEGYWESRGGNTRVIVFRPTAEEPAWRVRAVATGGEIIIPAPSETAEEKANTELSAFLYAASLNKVGVPRVH